MAEQATERTTISAPPERCYAVVADIERYPEWAVDIKDVRIDERDGEGRPSVCTFRVAAFGRSTSYTLEYDYRDAPRVLAWRQRDGDVTAKLDGRYVFDPSVGGGTDVTYHLEVELRVPIPGFVKLRAASRVMTTALRDLRIRAESTR